MVSQESRVSHYRLLAKLGQGAMGEVYRAEDVRLHRQVALKLLSGLRPDASDRARILEEARAIAALEHPHITLLYEYDEYEGGPFLAMQLVEGETLKSALARGPLPEARAREVLAAVASALAEAHARGIFHRDVKAENILLGDDGSIKLADFGVARFAEAAGSTQTGGAGTPAYMAPERIQGGRATEASDQFALGIVAYECLAGVRPFPGATVAGVLFAIMQNDPEPPSRVRSGIHSAWDAAVLRALAKDPRDRFPSVRDFARALPHAGDDVTRTTAGALAPGGSPGTGRAGREERTATAARTTGPGRSVAVLYFENPASDPESEYFCSGITEDLLADLGNLSGLRVASRSAVLRYRGTAVDVRRIGAELGVAAVLVGSVRRAGNRIRIAAELVSTIDGFQLWAQRYDRSIEDIFAVQDDMARTISEALRGVVTPTEAAEIQRGRPESAEAYDLYLRARELYGNFTHEENLKALECLERAVERNPRYALAWAGIADCCGQMYNKLWDAEERWLTRGLEAARRAVELGPDLPETHKALALNLSNRGDAEGAIAALRRALEIHPRFQPGLHNLGVELMQAGDFAGSERAYRRAIAVDAARWIAHIELAWLLICTRRYADALLEGNRGLRFSTRPWHRMSAHAIKIVALAYRGDFAAAEGELRAARATELEGTTLVTAEAFLAAASGKHERAREILAALSGKPHLFMSEAWVRPETAALLGDFETALRDLRELDQPHFVTKWPSLRILPGLSRLRDTPEFRAWIGERGRRIVWPLESPPLPAEDRAQFAEYAEASGIPAGDAIP